MKTRLVLIIFTIMSICSLYSEDALTILRKVDQNQNYSTIKYTGEMTITISGKKYIKSFNLAGQGTKNSFIEFINADDIGTKYLKKDGSLFVYSPDTEEIVPIVGHMLKESMMGSDLSYEDTLDNDTLESNYDPKITGEETINNKPCWVLELNGKKKTLSYPKRVLWVDKETYTTYKTELYSLSGVKIKELLVLDVKKIGSRYFPVIIEMHDLLRQNSSTVLKMFNVNLDGKIPDNTFSMRNLEK